MGLRERREREKELRKKQILRAGTKVFLKKGLENSTIQDIARSAELGRATVYYYYPSKKTILKDILLKGLDNFFERLIRDLNKAKNEMDLVEKFVLFNINFLRKNTAYFQVCYLALASSRISWVKNVVEDFSDSYFRWNEELKQIIFHHTNKRNAEKITKILPVFAFGLSYHYLLSKNTDDIYNSAKAFFKFYKK